MKSSAHRAQEAVVNLPGGTLPQALARSPSVLTGYSQATKDGLPSRLALTGGWQLNHLAVAFKCPGKVSLPFSALPKSHSFFCAFSFLFGPLPHFRGLRHRRSWYVRASSALLMLLSNARNTQRWCTAAALSRVFRHPLSLATD